MRKRIARIVGLSVAVLAAQVADAGTFSFLGNFTHDTDVQFFNFTLAGDTPNVSIRTWSYAGGTNGNGQNIAGGGFEPFVQVYFADGTAMNPGFLTNCPSLGLKQDPATSGCDVLFPNQFSPAFLPNVWPGGNYIVALSLDANQSLGDLSNGFWAPVVLGPSLELTAPFNFTCGEMFQGSPDPFQPDAPFCSDLAPGVQRDSHWALDIINVDSANIVNSSAVPEPATAMFALLGFAVMAARRRLHTGTR
jgi:uncharacterized protein (TIGR03382 family)